MFILRLENKRRKVCCLEGNVRESESTGERICKMADKSVNHHFWKMFFFLSLAVQRDLAKKRGFVFNNRPSPGVSLSKKGRKHGQCRCRPEMKDVSGASVPLSPAQRVGPAAGPGPGIPSAFPACHRFPPADRRRPFSVHSQSAAGSSLVLRLKSLTFYYHSTVNTLPPVGGCIA